MKQLRQQHDFLKLCKIVAGTLHMPFNRFVVIYTKLNSRYSKRKSDFNRPKND